MKAHNYYVYILSNKNNKVIYTGMTNDIYGRMYEHKNYILEGFTKKYKVDKLVYYELTLRTIKDLIYFVIPNLIRNLIFQHFGDAESSSA